MRKEEREAKGRALTPYVCCLLVGEYTPSCILKFEIVNRLFCSALAAPATSSLQITSNDNLSDKSIFAIDASKYKYTSMCVWLHDVKQCLAHRFLPLFGVLPPIVYSPKHSTNSGSPVKLKHHHADTQCNGLDAPITYCALRLSFSSCPS